jgi:RNA-binding protein YlmH
MVYVYTPTLLAALGACMTLTVLTVATFSTPTSAFTPVLKPTNLHRQQQQYGLRFSIDDIEAKALAASEAWDVHATSFLPTAEAAIVQEALANRGDIACFRVGGAEAPSRARFVFTNPELGMTLEAAEQEYCVVLSVNNAKSSQDPWPNMLTKIGVDLDNVGDVLVSDDGSIFLSVAPEVAKQCTRLLPKEVVGAGVSVSSLEPGEHMPEVGELQDMEVQRLDKRAQYSAQKGK